ncbi:DUF3857 domain-containing protein [Flavisolibacter nicotianae]|uniref:DUF3857 domain-containing protein n=1 Tax=Flavisolibacter nicotianae TaxID=2364882 RepID=UPI000EB4F251|nr:DUF3857 domain-containing protein [Flavisolibacter nicotianae]
MRQAITFIFCCFIVRSVQGQQSTPSFATTPIPEELKKDADVVYRLDEGILNIASASEYTLKVHQVVTLLNAEGAQFLHHRLGTDKFYKVEDVTINMYDALGLLRKTYGKKDFETEAAFDGFSLVTDDKVMKLYTPAPTYPCTVDVQYTIHATGYIELPNWFINYHRSSTERFRYEVNVPSALDIRHRTLNMAITPQVSETGNQKHYMWETKNVMAKWLESDGYETARYLPQVEVAPNEFSYDGFKGSFRTWQDFGAWTFQLYEEKTPFSEQRQAEIKDLLSGATSRDEKIRILYRYLQQNMRYVSIQLGIGGFRPFPVKFVDEKKYGDCKALTNYMRCLLRVAGIKAYPALINAGANKIPADPQFPSDPFNHVILCIPGEKDSTWLECTSTTSLTGELGPFTENKKALLLTENGGVLVNTPKSDYHANRLLTKNTVTLDAEGGAVIQNRLESSGETTSFYKYIVQLDTDAQKEQLVKTLHYKEPDELAVSAQGETPAAAFALQRSYSKLYDFKSGNKYFFPLCIQPLAIERLLSAKRETDFLFSYPYEKRDTTVFLLPPGFSPDMLPADKELQTSYSQYRRSIRFDKTTNQVTVVSWLLLSQHVVKPLEYAGVVQFFKTVATLEEENLVLVKQ